MDTKPIDVVAAVIWKGGRVNPRCLAVQRPPGKVQAGFWEFPGGKLEPGETPEAALSRELDEELGIRPVDFHRFNVQEHAYEHARVRLFFFHVHAYGGRLEPREGQQTAWIDPRGDHGLGFLPADADVLELLAAVADQGFPDNPQKEDMPLNISEQIARNRPFVSLEFFPPKEREAWDRFFDAAARLKAADPLFVSVTYGAGGSTQDNTLEIATRLKQDVGFEPLVHLTTVGASQEKINDFLASLQEAGINNVLALRGDPPRGMTEFVPDNEDFQHASDLVTYINRHFPDMGVGVAAYPEAHPESPTVSHDIEMLKLKLDAGADLAMTQLFFDNRLYFDLVERLAAMGVDKPVVPGVLPIMSLGSVRFILNLCGASIPGRFYLELEEADKKGGAREVRKIGIDYAIRQCRDLIEGGAPGVHLYTLNQADACLEIAGALDL
jgi:methylenetetrahydrofolate reductase (NADPH)